MMFDFQPTLSDGLLTLRPVQADDWEALFAVAADPLIWALHPASDRYTEPVFRRFFDEGLASGGMIAVVDPASGAIIGSSRFDEYAPERSEVEIGWSFLARSHWGGRYNRAVKRMMLRHAFRFVESARFRVGENNVRSRAAMTKIGGVLSDQIDEVAVAGVIVAHVVFTIRKADFETSALGSGQD
jgi:N-acetyltransferase